jgi:hypothetical protein
MPSYIVMRRGESMFRKFSAERGYACALDVGEVCNSSCGDARRSSAPDIEAAQHPVATGAPLFLCRWTHPLFQTMLPRLVPAASAVERDERISSGCTFAALADWLPCHMTRCPSVELPAPAQTLGRAILRVSAIEIAVCAVCVCWPHLKVASELSSL